MSENPLVSIIIPCHNAVEYIAAAIESALAQDYSPVEVIVVDDGSSDGSRQVAQSFEDRVKILSQPNLGPSVARNAGIQASTGTYIILLDADDVLLTSCVRSRVEALMEDPRVGLVAGYYREIDANGQLLPRVPQIRRLRRTSVFRQTVRRNWGPPVGWGIRRATLDACGRFDPSLRHCEDWDLAVRLSAVARVGYVPTIQALFRRTPGTASSNHLAMLQGMDQQQRKNRVLARSRLLYWLDCRFGIFELGRRILYASLTTGPRGQALVDTCRLVVLRPELLWVGAVAVLTFLAGRRESSPTASASNHAYEGPVAEG